MRASVRAGLTLAAGIAATVVLMGGGGRERAAAASRPRLARPLRTIVVAHLPDRLRTFARVDVSRLRCGAACGVSTRVVTSPASRARIAASLVRIGTRPAKSGFDARWLVSATDANGATMTFACDRFGRTGAIDGRSVALWKTAPLLAALRRELPPNER